jgi:peptidoglycan/xylan/chitin deacetylase (PgdA/CDA1 family)
VTQPDNRHLLVTIDTEPDDEWSHPKQITTENILRIPRLQAIFDQYGVRPTYFVSYCVARDPRAVDILGPIQADGRCEIGTHLHGWNTPPHEGTPEALRHCHPYLYQYPKELQRRKFETVHRAITDAFGIEPTSHRAGKYGLDTFGLSLLRDFGYTVDSSVTPMRNWDDDVQAGTPGPDFSRAPLNAYELDTEDLCRSGHSGVMEVPVSIGYCGRPSDRLVEWLKVRGDMHFGVRIVGKLMGVRRRWFRPFIGIPLSEIEDTAQWLLDHRAGFLNMMFHSSELIPNSHYCRTEAEVAKFLGHITAMMETAINMGFNPGIRLANFAKSNNIAGEGK